MNESGPCMKLKTVKGFIATEPFDEKEIKSGVKTMGSTFKVETISALTTLSKLKVLVDSEDWSLKAGDYIYVESKMGLTPWAKNRLQVGEIQFILVPAQSIILKEFDENAMDW